MKKLIVALSFFAFFQACTSPVEPAPAGLLPQKKMAEVLVDIHVMEARLENLGLVHDSATVHFQKLQREIFKKHGVTEEQFQKSYDYYVFNVSELDKIYEKVVDSLSVKEIESGITPRPQEAQ